MSMSSRWTDQAFARLETIVREQEAARARLDAIEREWSTQRTEAMATIATLSAEYDELYVALDAYADVESQAPDDALPYPPPWGVAALPTGFAAPPVQWEPFVANPADLASSEPEPRRRAATAVAVVLGTILALGIGILIAAFVSGRVDVDEVALPTAAMDRTATTPAAIARASTVPASSPLAAAIASPSTTDDDARPQAVVTLQPAATKSVATKPAASKRKSAKRAKQQRAAKRHKKKARATRAKPKIGLPASSDPLAGA